MQHRLGLYLDHDERPGDALRMLTVTGVADSCERMGRALKVEQAAEDRRATGPDDPIVIHMLGGYCHYYGGAVLWGTSWRALPWSGYERVTGEAARRRLGNLVHVERAWPRYGKLRRIGEDFRRAIREGDRARLSALHGKFGAGREELDYLLVDKDSPFLELRDLAHRGRTALLANDLGYEGEPPETVETADGFVCFCRAGDCGDLWPIADIDTGHAEEHPYACLEVSTDAVGEVDVRAKRTPAPLAEPPAARLPLPRR